MNAQCTMQGCGQLILSRNALEMANSLGRPASDQEEFAELERAITVHMIQFHPDISQAIAAASTGFAASLFGKLTQSADPRFHEEQYESFKRHYWLLAGTLTTTQTAGAVTMPTREKKGQPAPSVVFNDRTKE